jgi:hypothetical protein
MKIIILKAPHRHQGVNYKAGDEIELTDAEYDWLITATLGLRHDHREKLVDTVGTQEWVQEQFRARDAAAAASEDEGDE